MEKALAGWVFVVALCLGLTGAATAQTAGSTPVRGAVGGSPTPTFPPPSFRTGPLSPNSVVNEAFPYAVTRLTGYVHTQETDRADRVSRLIDRGKCKEAQDLADAEHDTLMAAKVPKVCEMKRRGLL